MSSELFIGIPCYEEKPILQQTLQFLKQRTAGEFQLEVNVAKQSVVKNKNALLAKARLSKAEFICLGDDDVEPEAGWDAKLCEAVEGIERASGALVGEVAPCFYSATGPQNMWLNTNVCTDDPYEWIDAANPKQAGIPVERYLQTGFVGAVPGTLVFYHRRFLERLNWEFDDRYERSQTEDIDQSLACRDVGLQVLLVGGVKVIHHQILGRHPRAHNANMRRFVEKWRGREDLCWPPATASKYAEFSLEALAWKDKFERLRNRMQGSLCWQLASRARAVARSVHKRFVP